MGNSNPHLTRSAYRVFSASPVCSSSVADVTRSANSSSPTSRARMWRVDRTRSRVLRSRQKRRRDVPISVFGFSGAARPIASIVATGTRGPGSRREEVHCESTLILCGVLYVRLAYKNIVINHAFETGRQCYHRSPHLQSKQHAVLGNELYGLWTGVKELSG